MPDELPPVVTRLTGDIEPLAKTYAEAEALADAYGKTAADKLEKGGGKAGERGGKALLDEFEKEIGRRDPLADFATKVDTQFKKAGGDNVKSWAGEFDRLMKDELGGSGRFGRIVGDFEKLGNRSGGGFFSNIIESAKGIQFGDAAKNLGVDFSRGFVRGMASFFDNPIAIGIGIPVVATLVTEALAGLGGAVGTTLGLGGITAGIVGSFHDPAVHTAIVDLGHDAKSVLSDSTSSFLDPLVQGAEKLDGFFKHMEPDFARMFEPISKAVIPLETGIEAFISRMLPGLQDGMSRAAPLVDAFAKELPEIGAAVSDFLEKVTASEGGDKAGLTAIIDLLDMAIRGTGNLIEAGSHLYAAYVDAAAPIADLLDNTVGGMLRAIGHIPLIGLPFKQAGTYMHDSRLEADKLYGAVNQTDGGMGKLADSTQKVDDALAKQKDDIGKVTKAWDDWFGKSLSLDQATLKYHEDVTALNDALTQNGRTFDLSTKKGQENYSALLDSIQGAHDLRQAEIDSGVAAAQANKEYSDNITYLLGVAQKAGLSKDQIALLVGQVDQLNNSLDSINGKSVSWTVVGHWVPPTGGGFSSIPFMADGGFVTAADGLLPARSPGTLVLAGEPQTRGEWMIPRAGISQQRAAALIGGAAADHGMSVSGQGGGGDTILQVRFQIGDVEFYEQVVLPGKKKFDRYYGTTT